MPRAGNHDKPHVRTVRRLSGWQVPRRLDHYRYRLGFTVNPHGAGRVLVIGLNPSTATLTTTDPTVDGFCTSWARRAGFQELEIVNLFAYRSTDKRALLRVANPAGEHNDRNIREALTEADIVIAAWGSHFHPLIHERSRHVLNMIQTHCRCPVRALGRNLDRSPTHPLYHRLDSPLLDFPWSNA